jgi:glucose/arabinose dehydrogenase
MNRILKMLAALAFAPSSWAGVLGSQYGEAGRCGPYARADVTTPEGMCLGIVAGPAQGLRLPRTIVEWRPGRLFIADMSGWVSAKGRILRLTLAPDGTATVATVFSGLRQPHGLALGPDGKIYVGEKGRISRFDPGAEKPELEPIATGLPDDGIHPLTNLIFDKDGALIVNVGATNDRCETKANPTVPQDPCPLTQGERPRAALWRLTFDAPGGRVIKTEPLARGLRNSMALAIDPASGELLQAENGVDLPGEDEPAEEINVIAAGAHYGWPHCWGVDTPLRGAKVTKTQCRTYAPAAALLPPHSAPLGMLAYNGAMFSKLKGRLLIALHGYRKYGQRIVSADVQQVMNAKGGKAKLQDVVSGWARKRGVRPAGAPTGMAIGHDGAIWFAEDRNRTIMVLLKSDGTKTPLASAQDAVPAAPPPAGWDAFTAKVLKAKCAACHVEVRQDKAADIWSAMVSVGWVGEGPLKDSKLARALTGAGPEKPMPPPSGLAGDAEAMAAFNALLGANP